MDVGEIKRAVKAARTIKHEIDGRTFTVVLPRPVDFMASYLEFGGGSGKKKTDEAAWIKAISAAVDSGLSGWAGVTVNDLLGNGDAEPLEFDPELIEALLDARVNWSRALRNEVEARISERATKAKADEKN